MRTKKHLCEKVVNTAPMYVAVYDYEGEQYLEEVYIVGWSNRSDWFTDISGDEILTPAGNLKKSSTDFIQVGRGDGALVSADLNYVKKYAADAINEGYDCTVCEIKKDINGDWIIIKVDNKEHHLEESFMKIHERKSTAKNKNLTEVYKILDKYGRVDEDVDKVFRRASLTEQRKMIKLLEEGRTLTKIRRVAESIDGAEKWLQYHVVVEYDGDTFGDEFSDFMSAKEYAIEVFDDYSADAEDKLYTHITIYYYETEEAFENGKDKIVFFLSTDPKYASENSKF